jgi:hypothetical protein
MSYQLVAASLDGQMSNLNYYLPLVFVLIEQIRYEIFIMYSQIVNIDSPRLSQIVTHYFYFQIFYSDEHTFERALNIK